MQPPINLDGIGVLPKRTTVEAMNRSKSAGHAATSVQTCSSFNAKHNVIQQPREYREDEWRDEGSFECRR